MKILFGIDGMGLDMSALEFACYLGRLTHSKVTGIFLENLVAEERLVMRTFQGAKYPDWEIDEESEKYKARIHAIEKNIGLFKEACEKRSVGYSIHRDEGVPAREMITESRFADVLVIDAATSFNKRYEGAPSGFVKDILKEAECPVIIAPESFDGIDEIIFAYNGAPASVFAIKQFTYLFPRLKDTNITIVQVNEDDVTRTEDGEHFREWLQEHYSTFQFEILKGQTDSQLLGYLLGRKNLFIIMGAYGRPVLSQFFKHSSAEILIKTISQPIFISHY